MNLTVALVSAATFLAIFLYQQLFSKQKGETRASFFANAENVVMLILLVLFVGFFGGVLSMNQLDGIFSNARFADLTAFDAGRGFVFGSAAHKVLSGRPLADEALASDDTPVTELRVPIWRKFVMWRNS